MSGKNLRVNLIANTSQFKSAMAESSNQIKLLNSEFKNAAAETDQYGNKLDSTSAKKKQLTGVIQQYTNRVKAIKTEQAHWTRELEKGNVTEEQHAQKQQELARRLNNTESEMKKYEGQLKQLNAEGKAAKKTFEEFDRQFRDVGESMQKWGTAVGIASGAMFAGLVKVGKDAINITKDFETEMSKVQALTRANTDEFEELKDMAKHLGDTTMFSAQTAAEAMSFLGMAGFEVNEIIDATPGLLDLAASAQMDLGRAADITSNILSGFGMEASKSGKVSDVLARASSNANTNVEQMGDSMKVVAPIASTLGMSLEDMAAGTMVMSDAGIQGSEAGRMLRQGLIRLSKPTGEAGDLIEELGINVFDADGNMKSLDKVVAELQKGMGGMTSQAETAALALLFGSESTAGWSSLLAKGSVALADYTVDLKNSEGAAREMADTMQDNLQGSLYELESGLEGLQIMFGEKIIPIVREGADWLTELTQKFLEMDDATVDTIASTALVTAGVLGVVSAIGLATAAIGALMMFAGPLGLAIVGTTTILGALGIGLYAAKTHTENLQKQQREARQDALNYGANLSEGTKTGVKAYTDLYENAKIKMVELRTMSGDEAAKTVKEIQKAFSEMADVVIAELEVQRDELTRVINEIYGTVGEAGAATAEQVTDKVLELFDKDIAEYRKARDTINEIVEEYGSNWADYPPKIQQAYNEAYAIMDQGAAVFAGTQKEMQAIQERIIDQGGAIQNQQAQEFINRINDTYGSSLDAIRDHYNERRDVLDQGLAQEKISYAEHSELMKGLEQQTTGMYADAGKKRNEALQELAGHVDKRGELLDFETGKILERQEIEEGVATAHGLVNIKRAETDEEYYQRWLEKQEGYLANTEKFANETNKVANEQQIEFLQSLGYTYDEALILMDEFNRDTTDALSNNAEEAMEAGKAKGDHYIMGLSDAVPGSQKTAKEIIDAHNVELEKSQAETESLGKASGKHYIMGLDSTTASARNAAEDFSNASNQGLGTGDGTSKQHGKDKGTAHKEGLESTRGSNRKTSRVLSLDVTKELRSTTDGGGGSRAGSLFRQGLVSWAGRVNTGGRSVASSGERGLRSVSTAGAGSGFVAGFRGSINSGGGSVWSAAWSLGKSALSALKRSINSHSPSKETEKEGENFIDGFALSIDKGKKESARAAAMVGRESVEALNKEVSGFKQSFGAIALAVEGNKQTLKVQHEINNSGLENKIASLEGVLEKLITAMGKKEDNSERKEQPIVINNYVRNDDDINKIDNMLNNLSNRRQAAFGGGRD
ncbi:phage tail tape measure protein [Oceanobacillus profundus]|uniref:phage tail tape measure protein n=1 Tax=Oceanobacillus TaxID=182709 RepID=UPI0026E45AB0|nr:phage tail tape measure protein [Oceanobacillus profundus]MDO6448084.1 phage tail tape measure protein [Oceanobacillus profundus]